jgi:ATP-dependent DNA helicase RecQ
MISFTLTQKQYPPITPISQIGSLSIDQNTLPTGSVLLIDDMVDSRWTMTVASWLLRRAGSGEVFPLALSLL